MCSTPQSRDIPVHTGKGNGQSSRQHSGRRPEKKLNPLQAGIQEFINSQIPPSLLSEFHSPTDTLTSTLPKRFTIYEPLLLLPANAFSAPPRWAALYAALTTEQREALYASITKAFSRMGVTHIAVNAPIALSNSRGQVNRLRSPTGLIPLYGDFGDLPLVSDTGEENAQPRKADLEGAFWVRVTQNHGIVQIWAPLHTMFSRGNITEKARILGQGPPEHTLEGLDEQSLQGQAVANVSVVDMYAGVGYFVFSYVQRGVGRVWCWELNGWSVEGLRRGCMANRWGCRVVKVLGDGGLERPIEDLVGSLTDADRVVVFHGDNRFAADILEKVKRVMERQGTWNPVRHVNLGLLPSSQPSWGNACRMLDLRTGGWLHVHENVDICEIEQKKREIVGELGRLRSLVPVGQAIFDDPTADCCHVEHVKTYAPGVMHCVFDVRLSALSSARE